MGMIKTTTGKAVQWNLGFSISKTAIVDMHRLAASLFPKWVWNKWYSEGPRRPPHYSSYWGFVGPVNLQKAGEYLLLTGLEDPLHTFNAQCYRRQMPGENWVPDEGNNDVPSLMSRPELTCYCLVLSLSISVWSRDSALCDRDWSTH